MWVNGQKCVKGGLNQPAQTEQTHGTLIKRVVHFGVHSDDIVIYKNVYVLAQTRRSGNLYERQRHYTDSYLLWE